MKLYLIIHWSFIRYIATISIFPGCSIIVRSIIGKQILNAILTNIKNSIKKLCTNIKEDNIQDLYYNKSFIEGIFYLIKKC